MAPRFDLVDIVKTLQQKARYILIIAIVAGVLGAIVFLVRQKEYQARTEFFVANPMYTDRANIFKDEGSFFDYFAKEDDIDKVMAMGKSDSLKKRIISDLRLDTVYKKNPAVPKEMFKLLELFDSRYEIKRTEYTSLEVSYTDPDGALSADVANHIVHTLADMYSGYYAYLRNQVEQSLQERIIELDSSIVVLTDSLGAIREHYKFYDMVSPSRRNMIMVNIHASSVPGFGKAIEEIQNLESIKDKVVVDRAQYMTLINEFATGKKAGTLPMVQVLSKAHVPYRAAGFGLVITTVICGLVGLFFAILGVLLSAYFRTILHTER